MSRPITRRTVLCLPLVALAACDRPVGPPRFEDPGAGPKTLAASTDPRYGAVTDTGFDVPAVPEAYLPEEARRQIVRYQSPHAPGTLVVDPGARRLYQVRSGGQAMRFLAGVGAAGFEFSGEAQVARIAAWPRWTPTPDMLRRDPANFARLAKGLPGGPSNPLGARALYLYANGRDTLYRIHGTPAPWSVGHATSSGCIRLFNHDAIYLADRTQIGSKVIVLPG